MADVGDKLNDDDFFDDVVDTPKEDIEKGKAHLLGHKCTHGQSKQ